MSSHRPSRSMVVAVACTFTLSLAAPAAASDDTARRRGECTGGPSEWELRVGREDASTLRVRFEIEGGAEGQTWQVFLSADGGRIFAGNRTSQGGGHIRIVRQPHDRAGSDRIKAMGVNLVTGESCGGSLSY